MNKMKNWKDYKRIHFIGIGGIGMSALAQLLKSKGITISGSDGVQSGIIDSLSKLGTSINIGHDARNITDDVDCVVYTLAIGDDNPELIKAKENGIPTFTYAEMLGQVSKELRTIVISGTHGKTTTTAMTYFALVEKDLSLIVGSLISHNAERTNYIEGNSDIFVVEGCEYKKSFLNLSPEILVITNIEADHLDFYKDLEDVKKAFMELADKVPVNGRIICNFDDKNTLEIREKYPDKLVNYKDYISSVPELNVFGEYNRRNAAAALAVADTLEIASAKENLKLFQGTWRRMESHGVNKNGTLLFDDYGHHPTEIEAAINALREKFPEKKLVMFFQPHLFSRTKTLFNEFVDVLSKVDELYILPIYPAREPFDSTISSQMLVERIPNAKHINNFDEVREDIQKKGNDSVVVTMGAGDIEYVLRDL
jgi:UDP-N-acetylmuramate--alanine ligase